VGFSRNLNLQEQSSAVWSRKNDNKGTVKVTMGINLPRQQVLGSG
jgi:hypothetical protein